MKLSDFKFKIKPLEIVILILVIAGVSTGIILIKNKIKSEDVNNISLADKTEVLPGDSVVYSNDETTEVVNQEQENTNANKEEPKKIVIKQGSTAVLEIPSLNVIAQVTEGSDANTLRDYVGVVEGSSRPGQVGNYAVAAHNNVDTEIFRNLHTIENDALINVYTQSKIYTYKVTDKFNVKPTQIEVLDKSNKKEITLITCNYNATERVIVKGILVDEKIARKAN